MAKEITYENVRRFYNDFYYKESEGNRPGWHYRRYLQYLKVDRADSGKRILDIGCGNGHLLGHAANLSLSCSGIDISDKALNFAKNKYPQLDLRCGIAEELPWPADNFDFITCLGCLEHFLDQPKALSEMLRVAKKDAHFLAMVPNRDYPDFEGTDQQQIRETLLSFEEWKAMLENAGLRITAIYADKWPVHWIPLPKKHPLRFLRGLYARYKLWSLPLRKSYQFIFVAQRK